MVTLHDPISDMLIRIKNAYMAHSTTLSMPYSKMKAAVAAVLVDEGYLASKAQEGDQLVLTLKYTNRTAALTNVQRISKPGGRVYTSIKNLPRVLGGLGMHILSTPAGIMSQRKAYKLNVGGEVLARIW
jgi:small subunit ribosomal protein S8